MVSLSGSVGIICIFLFIRFTDFDLLVYPFGDILCGEFFFFIFCIHDFIWFANGSSKVSYLV